MPKSDKHHELILGKLTNEASEEGGGGDDNDDVDGSIGDDDGDVRDEGMMTLVMISEF